MRHLLSLTALLLILGSLSCSGLEPPLEGPETAYGFFPSPPVFSEERIISHFEDLGRHADFLLLQPNVPWKAFAGDGDVEDTVAVKDLRAQVKLAERNGLGQVFVTDPLNGLNRREFHDLPEGWRASFAEPRVREAYRRFALWIAEEFNPRYLGLASEINTYMDTHPEDARHFLSLYREVYAAIKDRSPGTKVFVTFQWEDLNNLLQGAAEGRRAYQTNWEQVRAFEPRLDIWAISSYPYFVFEHGSEIPEDYYTPLLSATDKPLAVAEGGFTSLRAKQDQRAYLQAVHEQLGERLDFWVYLILSDLDMESIGAFLRGQGAGERDVETLRLFASIGLRKTDDTPKPALELWDEYRQGQ